MSESLREHFNKSQTFLKLGDKEHFEGRYVSWEPILIAKYNKKGYRFVLEREDGSRVSWDTANARVVLQFSDLIDKGLKKGDPIKIYREGTEKDNTKYTITAEVPF